MKLNIRWSNRLGETLKVLLFAVLCLGMARLGMLFALDTSKISLVWPLTGVSLAVVYLLGRKYALGLALAQFTNSVLIGMSPLLALGVACGSTGMALFGAYGLSRWGDFRPAFSRVRDVLNFVVVGVVLSPLVSAVAGTTCFLAAGLLTADVYVFNMFTWWVGDAVGVLLVAPVLLVWVKAPFRKPERREVVEALILAALLGATAWMVFGGTLGGRSFYPLAYLVFPFLIWSALRFEQRMVASMTLLTATIAVIETSQAFGTLSQLMVWNSVLFLWAYIATMTVTSMLLAAVLSERRQIEQRVRSLETRFTTAFKAAPMVIWLCHIETGRLVEVNDDFCNLLGYSREEALAQMSFDLKLWESAEVRSNVIGDLLQKERIEQIEGRLWTKAGELRSGLISLELMDLNGEPHYFNMFQDMTARLSAESALRENEARYRMLFEGIDDAVFIHDFEANILDVNEATCRRLGYSRDELLRMKVTDLDAPEFAAGFSERLRQQLVQGYMNQIEGVQVAKDGRRIFLDVNTKLITYRGQQAIFAVDRDITERKLAEAKLRESEMRYRAIIEDQTEMICRLNPDWTLTFVNDAFCRYHGMSREQLIGMPFQPKLHVDDQERVSGLIRGLSVHNPAVTAEYRVLLPQLTPEGTSRWHQWTHRAITNSQGQIVEYQFVGKDVTVLKELQEQRLAITLEHEKVEMLSDFIAAASHDFRTPLSVINTSAYLLNRITNAPQRQHHLDQIQGQTHHIERMIDGLLTMMRLDRGDVFRFKPIKLNAVIQQAAQRIQAEVDEKALTLALELEVDLPTIYADALWLDTALMQMIENAIHFTSAGGTVSVGTCADADGVVITVRDTGVGIPAETMPHIFKRLYKGEEHRPMGGQGLGLSMVWRIVEAHEGRIDVESDPGAGSTFRVLLPLKPPSLTLPDTSAAPALAP